MWQSRPVDGDHCGSLDSRWDNPRNPCVVCTDVDLTNASHAVVHAGCFELGGLRQAFCELHIQLGPGRFRLAQCARRAPVTSRPQRRPPAHEHRRTSLDAWRRGDRSGASTDEASVSFERPDGVAVAVIPDGTIRHDPGGVVQLVVAETVPLPVLDQIAADGGRILAKEAGLTVSIRDDGHVHPSRRQAATAPPSTFFKLDPSSTSRAPPRRPAGTLPGCFGGPPTERFPFFEAVETSS